MLESPPILEMEKWYLVVNTVNVQVIKRIITGRKTEMGFRALIEILEDTKNQTVRK